MVVHARSCVRGRLAVARRAQELGWHSVGVKASPAAAHRAMSSTFLWLHADDRIVGQGIEMRCTVISEGPCDRSMQCSGWSGDEPLRPHGA